MHGASVDAELQRSLFDGAGSGSEQQHDHVTHLGRRCRHSRLRLRLAGLVGRFAHTVTLVMA
jgi:hypothetical protein